MYYYVSIYNDGGEGSPYFIYRFWTHVTTLFILSLLYIFNHNWNIVYLSVSETDGTSINISLVTNVEIHDSMHAIQRYRTLLLSPLLLMTLIV